MRPISPTELVTKVKLNINSVEVHPQLSNNGHPVDGSLWLNMVTSSIIVPFHCTKHMLLLHQASKALWLHYLPTYLPTKPYSLTLRLPDQDNRSKENHPLPTTQQFALYTPVVLPKCTDAKEPAQKKQK
jgi:hypothetical protein